MNKNSNKRIFKIVFVGEEGVGKTNIISQYINHKFNENHKKTLGADFLTKNITLDDNTSFVFIIWDISGNKRYRELNASFLRETKVFILVYNITRKESFDDLKNYWIPTIQEYLNKETILAIVANKYDLAGKEVNEEDVLHLSENINAIYCHTSAKKDLGINDLFDKIVKKLNTKIFKE